MKAYRIIIIFFFLRGSSHYYCLSLQSSLPQGIIKGKNGEYEPNMCRNSSKNFSLN